MTDTLEFQKIVGEVAAAYFGNSHVTPSEIGNVIQQIAASLSAVATRPSGAPDAPTSEPTPGEVLPKLTAAQIRRSITPDALISFEDYRPYKTLRRHLAVKGLTPEQYRDKWGLPRDYPMVAPSYSASRAELARAIGLGSRGAGQTIAAPASPQPDEPPSFAPATASANTSMSASAASEPPTPEPSTPAPAPRSRGQRTQAARSAPASARKSRKKGESRS